MTVIVKDVKAHAVLGVKLCTKAIKLLTNSSDKVVVFLTVFDKRGP